MTDEQLEKIKQFAKSFDDKVDQFHDSRHAELTVKYAFLLAKDYPEADLNILEAACWLHDIGRINEDEEHAKESARLAEPFLKEIGVSQEETEAIVHAVFVHKPQHIHMAKRIEDKLLYDADKIQIISTFGFIRLICYLVLEKRIDFREAVEKRLQKVHEHWQYIQTDKAKEMLRPEIEKIEKLVQDFRNGLQGTLG